MFSCLSFTRRNTNESKLGSGTAIALEYVGFSVRVSENVRANATTYESMLIGMFRHGSSKTDQM